MGLGWEEGIGMRVYEERAGGRGAGADPGPGGGLGI